MPIYLNSEKQRGFSFNLIRRKPKDVKMSIDTKGAITLLIREIQDCKTRKDIDNLLETWIKANDLHPEDIQTFKDARELNKYLESINAPFKINGREKKQ